MMENHGSRQILELSVPLESLSICRQIAQLGSVKEESLRLSEEMELISDRQVARKSCVIVFSYCHFGALSDVASGSCLCHRNDIIVLNH
jgi:hypothetical protein